MKGGSWQSWLCGFHSFELISVCIRGLSFLCKPVSLHEDFLLASEHGRISKFLEDDIHSFHQLFWELLDLESVHALFNLRDAGRPDDDGSIAVPVPRPCQGQFSRSQTPFFCK